ncbi:hypothetical protein EOW65_02550 [Sinirhodobacter ferrireducens]|uniref:Uncharacterized protein n=1 Tax=Paenirhodobacter ferrireducens TaxID=1215032 RepID=A0A443LTK0_9RHOB|nr:hypothetical protein [Sinirhodobacter ferrireducens]RWR52473.1 hypothetical protein EOW65_02550 [Sinirhodobacter ferrireducens]
MQDKLPERPELDLLIVVTELHAERGAVDRAALQVVARGRGLEVARPLPGLIGAGLVTEITRRPSFLKRLFGARDEVVLAPTEAGQALIAALNGETVIEAAAAEPVAAESVAPEMPVVVEAAPEEVPVEAPAVPEAAPLEPAPSASEAPVAEIAVTEPLVAQAAAVEVAPVEPAAEDIPVAAAPPRPTPARARVIGFTEELGGAPEEAPPIAPVAVDPAVMDGLRELLESLGMEMTMAGEALIGTRIAQGFSAGEALSQLVLFAFAHAIRHDILFHGEMRALGLSEYAIEVMREVEKLRDAGEVGEARFEEDMRALWALLEEAPDRDARLDALLADPVGGAAPVAVLPEDLRSAEETEEEDEGF